MVAEIKVDKNAQKVYSDFKIYNVEELKTLG
jgi:hypothetical protein